MQFAKRNFCSYFILVLHVIFVLILVLILENIMSQSYITDVSSADQRIPGSVEAANDGMPPT